MRPLFPFIFLLMTISASAQNADSVFVRENYDLMEYRIPMRDGARLFTLAYVPKDKSKTHPILLKRTCYNVAAFGSFNMRGHPSKYLVRDNYFLVFQDVRGRYRSEGKFDNMTPNIPGNDPKNKTAIDESSDT
jgi:uncharacterized protein